MPRAAHLAKETAVWRLEQDLGFIVDRGPGSHQDLVVIDRAGRVYRRSGSEVPDLGHELISR